MGIQLLERLKALHALGYVHNDLKPENMVVGHTDPSTIHLIDFGLATKFREEDNSHIPKSQATIFNGNVLFASPHKAKLVTASRRDDILSMILVIAFLLNNCKLPW